MSVVSLSHHMKTLHTLPKSSHATLDLARFEYRLAPTGDQGFEFTPPVCAQTPKRKAVALDCEMVQVQGKIRKLASVCAIDYPTGEVLLNSFVRPEKKVTDWRSEYSGIIEEAMDGAIAVGIILDSWKAARVELFRFIDAETILVSHGLTTIWTC